LVTRKGLARENIELEELIRENLTQRGYKVLIPELMTVEQQIKEFSEASTVVGVHGGALANSIWSRRGTKVIEIQSHPYKTKDFEFLANKLRLEYNVMNFGQINEESKIEISKIE
jgi:capsular polysaccharide biosynthesis protein